MPTKLFWYGNGPWKRTELSGDAVVHNWPTVHSDFLTQVIDYRVPPEMFHLIAMFDVLNYCAIDARTSIDQAHDPINKDEELKLRYAEARLAARPRA